MCGLDPGLEFIVADARFLCLNTVDFVVAISLLEHVLGWNRIVSEAYRVLRRGSLFVVQLPNLTYLVEPHTKFLLLGLLPSRLRTILASSASYKDLQFNYTLKNIVKELEKHSFRYWISLYHHISHGVQ